MPAMPRIVLSEGRVWSLSLVTVAESREIPPLPVSRMKLRLSGKLPKLALIRITPPVNTVKGKLVINLAGAGINFSWASRHLPEKKARQVKDRKKSILWRRRER